MKKENAFYIIKDDHLKNCEGNNKYQIAKECWNKRNKECEKNLFKY